MDAYKDFEDGILTAKEMAKKYSVSTSTIYNWKKRWKKYVEAKKKDERVASFAKYATEIADRNVKGGVNKHTKLTIKAFIERNGIEHMDILQDTYKKFDILASKYRSRLWYKIELYLALSCLFDIKLINENKYFHSIVSDEDMEES